MQETQRCDGGYTLVELVIVIAILAALAAVGFAFYAKYASKSKAVADAASLDALNSATAAYRQEEPVPDLFQVRGTGDDALMQLLVNFGYIGAKAEPQETGMAFLWNFDSLAWELGPKLHTVTGGEVTMGTGGFSGYLTGSYSGDSAEILIPAKINGTTVSQIYQDAFNGKGLTAVSFASDSGVTRIHARAFQNNSLTEITLPDSVARLDYGAFAGNDITTVTIGAGVVMEGNVIGNSNSFRNAYIAAGSAAGTYVYENGSWVRQ